MMLTVFTPTYNRAYRLNLCYESLLRQTNKDFKWLIIDDGSSDNTKELVESWINENKLEINYIFQENQGVAKAHETALLNIYTELNICIDSDDYMPDEAVQDILNFWKVNGSPEYAGFIGLDKYRDGRLVGTGLPKNIKAARFADIYEVHGVKGDKKIVNRTDLTRKYLPYPKINNERFPAVSYLYLLINRDKKYLLCNKFFCIVEYLPDGISMNKADHYKRSPNSFSLFRIEKMKESQKWKDKFRHAVHYVCSNLFAKRNDTLKKSPYKILTILAYPFGLFLYFYLLNDRLGKVNRGLNKK